MAVGSPTGCGRDESAGLGGLAWGAGGLNGFGNEGPRRGRRGHRGRKPRDGVGRRKVAPGGRGRVLPSRPLEACGCCAPVGSGGSEWRLEPSPGGSHRPFRRAVCSAWKGHALWMPLLAFLLRFTEVASSEAIVCRYLTSAAMCHRPRERCGVACGRSVGGGAFCRELCGRPWAPRERPGFAAGPCPHAGRGLCALRGVGGSSMRDGP